jgi:purine nucleoside permease
MAEHAKSLSRIFPLNRDFARLFVAGLVACAFCVALARRQVTATLQKPVQVKVVVIAAFERGEDTGDTPGEFQLWVEREHLDQVLSLPGGYHHLRMNKDGVLGMVTGVGTAKAAASVMALGLDPRFDLTKTYWLVAGIGGGDPADVSLGTAVWADHVIDGDLAFESTRDRFQTTGPQAMYLCEDKSRTKSHCALNWKARFTH